MGRPVSVLFIVVSPILIMVPGMWKGVYTYLWKKRVSGSMHDQRLEGGHTWAVEGQQL